MQKKQEERERKREITLAKPSFARKRTISPVLQVQMSLERKLSKRKSKPMWSPPLLNNVFKLRNKDFSLMARDLK